MGPTSYDLIVIGSGPAGESGGGGGGVRQAGGDHRRSSLVGGASANTGTLPSKTLRESALAISGLKARDLYGVDLSLRREATVAEFMYHERRVTANERRRIERGLSRHGVVLYHGTASFVDPHTIRVLTVAPPHDSGHVHGHEVGQGRPLSPPRHEILLRGDTILIATGSCPVRPPQFPFDNPRILDSDTILQLDHLPRSLAVVGAGVIGSEYACTFAALGPTSGSSTVATNCCRSLTPRSPAAGGRDAQPPRHRVPLEEPRDPLRGARLRRHHARIRHRRPALRRCRARCRRAVEQHRVAQPRRRRDRARPPRALDR